MADKIVQLKDKNSNNLYPISGSSLAESVSTGAIVDGAVTTPKISDGAVTSDKVNFLTYMTAGLSSSVTIQSPSSSAPFDRISLNTTFSSRGDDFTLENGHIRCNFTGDVIIFATLYEAARTGNGLTNVFIYKNSNNIVVGRHNVYSDYNYLHVGPVISTATCASGDYFSMSGRFQSQTAVSVGNGIEGTKFTIVRIA